MSKTRWSIRSIGLDDASAIAASSLNLVLNTPKASSEVNRLSLSSSLDEARAEG